MDCLHDLFCYVALFSTLKYLENIMTTPPKCSSSEDNISEKKKLELILERERKVLESIKNNVIAQQNDSKLNKDNPTGSHGNDELNSFNNPETEMKQESSLSSESDLIPIYHYALKPASSIDLNKKLLSVDQSSINTGSKLKLDPPANLTDDSTDISSEYPISSHLSSKMLDDPREKTSSSDLSSRNPLLKSKKKRNINNFTDVSTTELDNETEEMKKNIIEHIIEIKVEKKTLNVSSEKVVTTSLYFNSNMGISSDEPSTSKITSQTNAPSKVRLLNEKTSGTSIDTPEHCKSKGQTHKSLVSAFGKISLQSYFSHQELNNSREIANIDENVKQNEALQEEFPMAISSTSINSECSEAFSDITGFDNLGEDELYVNGPSLMSHKTLLDQKFIDRSPNGSTVAVIDFDVFGWNEPPEDAPTAGPSKE